MKLGRLTGDFSQEGTRSVAPDEGSGALTPCFCALNNSQVDT